MVVRYAHVIDCLYPGYWSCAKRIKRAVMKVLNSWSSLAAHGATVDADHRVGIGEELTVLDADAYTASTG